MSSPRLSVLLPLYNGERFLSEAIVSVLEQTFTDFELLIVDDGSSDGSASIVRSFSARDSRIRGFFLGKNVGISAAMNRGLREARAPLIARMDCDDICAPSRFAKQVAYMDKHEDIYMLGCASVNMDEYGNRIKGLKNSKVPFAIGRKRISDCIDKGSYPLLHPTLMYRTAAVLALGGYREIFSIGEDIDLYKRMLNCYGDVFANLSSKLYFYRRYPGSSTQMNNLLKHSLVQTLIHYSSECRARGLSDPLASARELSFSSLVISAKERKRLEALHFFNSLYSFPSTKRARATFLRRADRLLDKYFPSKIELRDFPHPHLQLARASARSEAPILFLRYIRQALRYNFLIILSLLLRKVIFVLRCILEEGVEFIKRLLIFSSYGGYVNLQSSPAVSIVMTTYNRVGFISEAVASLQRQTFSNFELIIVDDGSSDGTDKVLKNIARLDKRVRLIFLEKNRGIAYAANCGIRASRAAFIARADSDDISFPRRLERQVSYMLRHPRVSILGCLSSAIDDRGRVLGGSVFLRRGGSVLRSLQQGAVPLVHSSIMLRASAFPVGGYNELFSVGAEDFDLFLRMGIPSSIPSSIPSGTSSGIFCGGLLRRRKVISKVISKVIFTNLPEVLVSYSRHGDQSTSNCAEQILRNHCYALFSARRRAMGLPDPLRNREVVDIEQASSFMSSAERACFSQDLASQRLLSDISTGKRLSNSEIFVRFNRLRAGVLSRDRFVWVALSLAHSQARRGFRLQAARFLLRSFCAAPLCSFITLYDSLRTRRYSF